MYYLGIDGGGTKTEALIVSEDMRELHRFRSGAINYNGESEENIYAHISEIFLEADKLEGLNNCAGVCIGMAGISNPVAVCCIQGAVKAAGYEKEVLLKGDQVTGLAGALDGKAGATLIAGTGSICVGIDGKGNMHRTGGYGNIIDDGGSGYAIGRDILSATVRAFDGRGQATVLTDLVKGRMRELSLDAGEDWISSLIRFLYDKTTSKGDIASFGQLISKAIKADDEVAIVIAEKAVSELFLLTSALVEKLLATTAANELSIAYCGSVVTKNYYIREKLTERLKSRYEGISCIMPLHDAAYGACLLAKEQHLSGYDVH